MKISKQELLAMGAKQSLIDIFIKQTHGIDSHVDVGSLVGGKSTYRDLLWLADKKLNKFNLVSFVCACALLNTNNSFTGSIANRITIHTLAFIEYGDYENVALVATYAASISKESEDKINALLTQLFND